MRVTDPRNHRSLWEIIKTTHRYEPFWFYLVVFFILVTLVGIARSLGLLPTPLF